MKRVITVQVRMTMRRGATQQEVVEFVRQALRTELILRNGSANIATLTKNAPVEPDPAPTVRVAKLDTDYIKENL